MRGEAEPRAGKIALYPAEDLSRVVILRRGPSKWISLLVWTLDEDVVEAGGWLKAITDPNRCDVSPNGRLFILKSTNYARGDANSGALTTLTLVVRPPWVTALAMWDSTGYSGNGGGRFVSNRLIEIHDAGSGELKKCMPGWLKWRRWDGPWDWGKKEHVWMDQWSGELRGRSYRYADGWLERRVDSTWTAIHDLRVTEPDPRPAPDEASVWPGRPKS